MINGKADGIEVGLYVFSLLHYAVGVDLAVLFCVEWRKPSWGDAVIRERECSISRIPHWL